MNKSVNRTKLILIVCLSLCFGTILCFWWTTRLISFLNIMEVAGKGQAPERSLELTIAQSQREDLFDQLGAFAKKHGFKHEVTDFNTNGENFQFWMSRQDLRIIAGDVPPDPTSVLIRFYAKYPGYPVDEETVDSLFNDLKNFIGEIPDVKISE